MRPWHGVLLLALAACRSARVERVTALGAPEGPEILCVVAHPDDETAFAATLYQTRMLLDGACDIVVITNGEGGFKYSTLAEPLYGVELTEERIGRAELPAIRRREFLSGCAILGVRDAFFLDQSDHRYTTDPLEVLDPAAHVWDLDRVRGELRAILAAREYDFLITLAPTAQTHGHHKAATVLALEALAELPAQRRPVALCARTSKAGEVLPALTPLDGFPLTRVDAAASGLRFDRSRTFGYRDRLDYRIVVHWVIAEHKSQGTMQLAVGEADVEEFALFAIGPVGAAGKARAFFDSLVGSPFPVKSYGESGAGTSPYPSMRTVVRASSTSS